jgi:Fe-S-cluster containining protein
MFILILINDGGITLLAPTSVSAAALKKEGENLKFRSFLKNRADYDELDKQFLELHNELFSGYDCCQCTNCCRAYGVNLCENEIGVIASFLGVTEHAFIEKHLTQSIEGFEIKAPCCFLGKDGKCSIQDCKPAECRDFPYTDKPDRIESLLSVMSFAEECPVVFEIVERLKIQYGFKSR